MKFKRTRRLRTSNYIRDIVRETTLNKNDFIYPLFVKYGKKLKTEIISMPGVYQFSMDTILEEVREIYELGIKAIILFGIPENKDETGSDCYNDNGIIQKTLRIIKEKFPELICIADVCLCEFTSHGHCGVIKNKQIDNDKTLELLNKSSVSFAKAGADIIAPSGMMDGFVKSIRKSLDENNFVNLPIMSYSAKFASSFYGPFRDAAESPPKFGDRKTYQMDVANGREALREIEIDINEGADIVMVKPGLSYMDIICEARTRFDVPIAVYNVSGEYAMVKAAAEKGWIDERKVRDEILLSFKRAGADLIISYYAKDWITDYC